MSCCWTTPKSYQTHIFVLQFRKWIAYAISLGVKYHAKGDLLKDPWNQFDFIPIQRKNRPLVLDLVKEFCDDLSIGMILVEPNIFHWYIRYGLEDTLVDVV